MVGILGVSLPVISMWLSYPECELSHQMNDHLSSSAGYVFSVKLTDNGTVQAGGAVISLSCLWLSWVPGSEVVTNLRDVMRLVRACASTTGIGARGVDKADLTQCVGDFSLAFTGTNRACMDRGVEGICSHDKRFSLGYFLCYIIDFLIFILFHSLVLVLPMQLLVMFFTLLHILILHPSFN
ncbi:hypothetical protein C8R42DRAFT_68671 [Lentinula raphanica]|nr:hypothetical protein C8R42DRAFT_68671 [Lentinula raphanica]